MGALKTSSTKAEKKPDSTPAPQSFLQRKCACGNNAGLDGECEECRSKKLGLQRRAASNTAPVSIPPIVHNVLQSPGEPLDAHTRATMEPKFGHDFSQVRVHRDAKAAESAQAVNALAYTVGKDVVFGPGQFAPSSSEGTRLLAHELTHVVQQDRGNVRGLASVARHEASYEREADHVAQNMSPGQSALPNISASGPALHRDEAPGTVVSSDVEQRAQRAELDCRIGELCGMRQEAPNVATDKRIRTAVQHCFPGQSIELDPCLQLKFISPNFGAPSSGGPFATEPTTEGRGKDSGKPMADNEIISSVRSAINAVTKGVPLVEHQRGRLNISVSGATAQLLLGRTTVGAKVSPGGVEAETRVGELNVGATINWSGDLGISTSYRGWHFSGSLSSEQWALNLSYPLGSTPPNLGELGRIFQEGEGAIRSIARDATRFRRLQDVTNISDTHGEQLGQVKRAIQAASAVADSSESNVSFGLSVRGSWSSGSEAIPTAEPSAAPSAGFEVSATVLFRF